MTSGRIQACSILAPDIMRNLTTLRKSLLTRPRHVKKTGKVKKGFSPEGG